MAYNDQRAYLGTFTLAAQNLIATASGQVVAGGTTITNLPIAEATFLCSIVGVVTATPSAFPAGVKPYVVSGTTTTTGSTSFAQSSGSVANCTFIPSVAIAAGSLITLGLVATGTASATETLGATTLVATFGPQYV